MNAFYKIVTGLTVAAVLTACGGSSSGGSSDPAPEPEAEPLAYEVSIVNLTAAQPFSPPAVIAHNGSYAPFELGAAASVAFENLAEGGSPTALLDEAGQNAAVITTVAAADPVGPGATATITFEVAADQQASLTVSIATMLVNTNDAFTGSSGVDISALAAGDSMMFTTGSYDSGTEANSEAAGTIPGPADGGEGFNAERDDVQDIITGHGGVVTADDGLSTSVLNQSHRWDNPTARITIRRTQ